MTSLLALHAIAAKRGDGLHPKLLAVLREHEATSSSGPVIVPLRSHASEWPAVNENGQDFARAASHASNPAVVATPASRTAS